MKKNQIWMATGAVVLALGGVLVGKATTKYAAPTALYYTAGVGVCRQVAASITSATGKLTTAGTGSQATLRTVGGGTRLIFATSTCSLNKKVYFTNP